MGDLWQTLKPKKTVTKRTIIEDDGYKREQKIKENCILCYATDVKLVGKFGTWNRPGSFQGVCGECLEKLNRLDKNEKLFI